MPFDLARLQTRGTPVPVIPDVVTTNNGGADAVVAGDGTLAYVSGSVAGVQRTLVWVDRQGRETPIPAPPRAYVYPRLSPDGTRVAVFAADQEADIWIWDLARTTLTRATFDAAFDAYPVESVVPHLRAAAREDVLQEAAKQLDAGQEDGSPVVQTRRHAPPTRATSPRFVAGSGCPCRWNGSILRIWSRTRRVQRVAIGARSNRPRDRHSFGGTFPERLLSLPSDQAAERRRKAVHS